ncbi:MAG: hypothetical protein JW804_03945 [Sedimentisphaerales bacterium]|nr:hypothetical protein [Sedimentisphaerales bacterium]
MTRREVAFLKGVLTLFEKLQSTQSKNEYLENIPPLSDYLTGKHITPTQKECIQQLKEYIGTTVGFIETLRKWERRYDSSEYTHQEIERLAEINKPFGFIYDMTNDAFWLELADSRFINELQRWIKEASGKAVDEMKTTPETIQYNGKIFGDKFSFWGLEIHWRNAWAKLKKYVKTILRKEK